MPDNIEHNALSHMIGGPKVEPAAFEGGFDSLLLDPHGPYIGLHLGNLFLGITRTSHAQGRGRR